MLSINCRKIERERAFFIAIHILFLKIEFDLPYGENEMNTKTGKKAKK